MEKHKSLMQNWRALAWSKDHIMAIFGVPASWSLLHSNYADKLLHTSIIPEDLYDAQVFFYAAQIITAPQYGFSYDSRLNQSRSDWSILTASAISNIEVRDFIIESVHKRAIWSSTIQSWPTLYSSDRASSTLGGASPAMEPATRCWLQSTFVLYVL
ncbi:hypothetical protein CPB83DRAFT_46996 [Crepidotus variabilis]|uniref:Glutaminase A central domain-containing protein n=1 Tax=Crepidotus variabilis TaxID=179855 RepID=A0A9P6EMZ4_9AGAR|nr:hypothetical protein CPB83DRAFT_46996 [Crepidotus variabilis]